jgi:hypothetical protein
MIELQEAFTLQLLSVDESNLPPSVCCLSTCHCPLKRTAELPAALFLHAPEAKYNMPAKVQVSKLLGLAVSTTEADF